MLKWKSEQWGLFGLPVVWAFVWIVLHFFRPTTFPWLGVIGGAVITIPLIIVLRIEQRSMAGRDHHDRDNDNRT